jgi:nicotinamidase-related amidase
MSNTALIIGDIQNGIVANFGNDTDLLSRIRKTVDAARHAGVPVIFVRVGFRTGHPDVSANNQMWAGVAKANVMLADDPSTQLHEALGVQESDIVITKRRVGAFHGTDLDLVLRARGITHFAIGGIATSGVILSTVRHGSDLDYQMTVLSDLTKDGDEEVNRVLLEKLLPRQAKVITSADWIAGLGGQ